MTPRKVLTLQDWASAVYGESAPHISTLRKWVRDGLIHPAPVKHGKQYFVSEDATYEPRHPVEGPRHD